MRALLAMPSSTMSLPSSGSITPRSTAMTSSGLGRSMWATPRFYRPGPCKLHDVSVTPAGDQGAPRLELLKTLGDNTRYAIYLELARSPQPLATAEIAESLALHPNTVRPHPERMREVGLLAVVTDARTTSGRPHPRPPPTQKAT